MVRERLAYVASLVEHACSSCNSIREQCVRFSHAISELLEIAEAQQQITNDALVSALSRGAVSAFIERMREDALRRGCTQEALLLERALQLLT